MLCLEAPTGQFSLELNKIHLEATFSSVSVYSSISFAPVLKLEEQILQFSLPGLPVRLAQGSAAGLNLGDKGRLRCNVQVPYLKI